MRKTGLILAMMLSMCGVESRGATYELKKAPQIPDWCQKLPTERGGKLICGISKIVQPGEIQAADRSAHADAMVQRVEYLGPRFQYQMEEAAKRLGIGPEVPNLVSGGWERVREFADHVPAGGEIRQREHQPTKGPEGRGLIGFVLVYFKDPVAPSTGDYPDELPPGNEDDLKLLSEMGRRILESRYRRGEIDARQLMDGLKLWGELEGKK